MGLVTDEDVSGKLSKWLKIHILIEIQLGYIKTVLVRY